MDLVINYEKLDSAAGLAKEVSKGLDDYYKNLNKKVQGTINNYRNRHSRECGRHITSAQSQISAKMREVAAQRSGFDAYSSRITKLSESAKEVESKIIRQMNQKLSDYCKKYGLEYHPSGEKVENENVFSRIFNWVKGKVEKIWEGIKVGLANLKDMFRMWYNYLGGKEFINVVVAVLAVIAAIAVIIVGWPALAFGSIAAFIWSCLVILASAVTLLITIANAMVQLGHLGAALGDAVNGEYFSASWNTKKSERKFTDQLREWQFYDAANIIDKVVLVAEVITFVDGFVKNIGKLKETLRVDKLFDIKHPVESVKNTIKAAKDLFKSQGGFRNMVKRNIQRMWGDGPMDFLQNAFFGTDDNGFAFENVFKGDDGLNWNNIKTFTGYLEAGNKILNGNSQTDVGEILWDDIGKEVVYNVVNTTFEWNRSETVVKNEYVETTNNTSSNQSSTETYKETDTYKVDNSTGKVVSGEMTKETTIEVRNSKGDTLGTTSTTETTSSTSSANPHNWTESRTDSSTTTTSDYRGHSETVSSSNTYSVSHDGASTTNPKNTIESNYSYSRTESVNGRETANTSSSSDFKYTQSKIGSNIEYNGEKTNVSNISSGKNGELFNNGPSNKNAVDRPSNVSIKNDQVKSVHTRQYTNGNTNIKATTTITNEKTDGSVKVSNIFEKTEKINKMRESAEKLEAHEQAGQNSTTGTLMNNAERMSERSNDLSRKLDAMQKNLDANKGNT